MFNATLALVEGRLHIKSTEVFATPPRVGFVVSNDNQYALSFLDMFFQGMYVHLINKVLLLKSLCATDKGRRKMVDVAPDTTGKYQEARTIRMKWARLYEYYEATMRVLQRPTVPLNQFCELRRVHRPHYIRHRKAAGHAKWNHMECTECTLLDMAIRKAPKAKFPEKRKELEMELEAHWADQELYRNHYSLTIVKAVENCDWDLAIHVDGGSSGSEYSPFFFQDIASGEQAPHFGLKVKNTFVQLHGWGNLVYQSYPLLEEQGTNLTIEVI
jgi:hypothetical protein